MSSAPVLLPKSSRRSTLSLLCWTYLFTVMGFPVHEAAHALVHRIQGTGFTMTLNHVYADQMSVAGLLAGPLVSLMFAWLGLWAAASGKLHPAPGFGIALGQLLGRPPLHIAMLFFGIGGNDETLAANLLGLHQAVMIIPSFLLFTGSIIWTAKYMRSKGYSYWVLAPAFVAVVAGIFTILTLDSVVFGV